MSDSPPNSGGWLELLHRTGESLLALLRSRFELFTVELQEEKLRLLNLLVLLGLALALGTAGIFVGIVALAFWLWAVAGYIGLIALAVIALAVAFGILCNSGLTETDAPILTSPFTGRSTTELTAW